MVLEGGSIAVDGAGTLVTTERCLLNPNRNPGMTRGDIERTLCTALGVNRIVWLADAIAEDDGTDGHVDNVVAFSGPGRALLQGCADPDNPNQAIAADKDAAEAHGSLGAVHTSAGDLVRAVGDSPCSSLRTCVPPQRRKRYPRLGRCRRRRTRDVAEQCIPTRGDRGTGRGAR
jgi:hypothetical protein